MGDRQMQVLATFQKWTLARFRFEANPAILELARCIVGQRRHWTFLEIGRDYQAGLEQALKAVADAKNQAFLVAEFAHHVAEKMLQLDGKNLPSCNVVAVSEAAWNRQNLVFQKEFRIFTQPLNVQSLGHGAG